MMTTQRAIEPHEFYAYAEASEICRHCDRGRYAAIHESVTLTTATDNRAEGEHRHTPLPWKAANNWIMRRNPTADVRIAVCDAYTPAKAVSDPRDRANAAFIIRACNEHYKRGTRIEQLEAALRDEISALAHWRGNGRGNERLSQSMRDQMAIRLTELRRVVEGK